MKFSKEYLQSYNDNLFETTIKKKSKRKYKEISETGVCGFKSCFIYDDNFVIECSAKLLHKNYKELININTFEQIFDNINSTGIMKIDKKAVSKCKVLKCDITKDIQVDNIEDIVRDLYLFHLNDKYLIEKYKYNGITLKKNNRDRRSKDRIMIYNKQLEVTRDLNLLQYINVKDFTGKLRFENNIRVHKKVRKKLNVSKENKLIDILESKENPIYDMVNNIYPYSSEQIKDIQNLMENKNKYSTYMTDTGRMQIIKLFDYNLDKIRIWLQGLKGTKNYTTEFKRFKYLIILHKYLDKSKFLNSINYIKLQLKD